MPDHEKKGRADRTKPRKTCFTSAPQTAFCDQQLPGRAHGWKKNSLGQILMLRTVLLFCKPFILTVWKLFPFGKTPSFQAMCNMHTVIINLWRLKWTCSSSVGILGVQKTGENTKYRAHTAVKHKGNKNCWYPPTILTNQKPLWKNDLIYCFCKMYAIPTILVYWCITVSKDLQ